MKSLKLSASECVLSALTIVAAVFAYHAFWYSGKHADLKKLELEAMNTELLLQTNQELVAKLASRKPASVELPSPEIQKYVNTNAKFSAVLNSLAESEPGSSAVISKIFADKQADYKGFTQTKLELQMEASFLSVGQFLERLENSDLLLEVESVEVHREPDDLKKCTAKIKLSSYVTRKHGA